MTRTLHVMFCICMLALCPVHRGFFTVSGCEAHAQTTSSPDHVYSDPKTVHPPVPIRTAEAEPPEEARRQQLDGFCIVVLMVDTKGLPQNARVVRCTDPIFAKNSLHAVESYRFQPATSLQDNKPVPFRTRIEISYRFGGNRHMIPAPRPRIKLDFLLPPQPAPAEPDNAGIYILSHAFDPPNSLPKLQRWVGVGYRRAAFALDDGAGCDVALTIHEDGHASDAKIIKCDDPFPRTTRAEFSAAISIRTRNPQRKARPRARSSSPRLRRFRPTRSPLMASAPNLAHVWEEICRPAPYLDPHPHSVSCDLRYMCSLPHAQNCQQVLI